MSKNLLTWRRYTEDPIEESSNGNGMSDATCDCDNMTRRDPLDIHFNRVSYHVTDFRANGSQSVCIDGSVSMKPNLVSLSQTRPNPQEKGVYMGEGDGTVSLM